MYEWRKSSFSNGNGGNNCVQVSDDESRCHTYVRDSKDPDGPVLVFTGEEWRAFIRGVKDGQFD